MLRARRDLDPASLHVEARVGLGWSGVRNRQGATSPAPRRSTVSIDCGQVAGRRGRAHDPQDELQGPPASICARFVHLLAFVGADALPGFNIPIPARDQRLMMQARPCRLASGTWKVLADLSHPKLPGRDRVLAVDGQSGLRASRWSIRRAYKGRNEYLIVIFVPARRHGTDRAAGPQRWADGVALPLSATA